MGMNYKKYTILIGILILIILIFIYLPKINYKEKVVKVGVLVPLTGFGDLGEKMGYGAKLAVEEINSKGGINGNKIKLIYEDSKCQSTTGVTALKKLIEINNVKMIVGPLCSGVAMSISPIAEESKILLIHGGLAPKLKFAGDYIFRDIPGASLLASIKADYLIKKLKIKDVALLFANTDFGAGYSEAFKESFEELGGEIISSEKFEQFTTDYRTQLIKIKSKSPEAIILVGSPNEMGLAIKQMKEIGIKATVFMPPSAEGQPLLEAGGDAVEGAIYIYGFDSESKESSTVEFIKKYQKKYNEKPSWHAAIAYDAVKIYALAIEDCNFDDSTCIKDNIYKINFSGAQGNLSFDEYGDAHTPLILKTIRNGEFVPYESDS